MQLDGVPGSNYIEGQFLGRRWRFPAGLFDLMYPQENSRASRSDQTVATFAGALQAKIVESPEEWILWRQI
jgi:hypothetical protein